MIYDKFNFYQFNYFVRIYTNMKKSQHANSLEMLISQTHSQDEYLLNVVENYQSEIQYFKSALANAERLIEFYKDQNQLLKYQNNILANKHHQGSKRFKQLRKNLVELQKQKQKRIEMQKQIEQLNRKLSKYQKTIQLLQDKLLILNLAIRKSEYSKKCLQINSIASQNSYLQKKQNQMLIYQDNEDSLESAIRTVEKSIRTPKMKKKGTTSTYETSVSRITDLRKKIPQIRNNRNKTQGVINSQVFSDSYTYRDSKNHDYYI